jgi:GT2 family glycosyltransferase
MILIRNESNLGYVRAINQGLGASDAKYICLLNNDTVVTKGWLSEMVAVAEYNPSIGIVNPSSNTLGQRIPKDKTLQEYAYSLKRYRREWVELGECFGFCMLIKREVISRIGEFDERYGLGYFEEVDYCYRAEKFGYKSVRSKAAYVYHIERVSFDKHPDKKRFYENNRRLLENRWGRQLKIGYIISRLPADTKNKNEIEQIILFSARRHHWLSVYIKIDMVSKFNFTEHSHIRILPFSGLFFNFFCLLKLLTRKPTRRFDLILCNSKFFYNIAKIFFKNKVLLSPYWKHVDEILERLAKNNKYK